MLPILKKTVRILNYVLLSLLFLILLFVGVINLPFAHRIITNKANSIFLEKGLPVHIGTFSLLINGNISLGELEVKSKTGEKIVDAGKVRLEVKLVPLFSNRIVIKNVELNDIDLNLQTDKNTGELEILSLFPASTDTVKKDVKPTTPWEIEINEAHLKNIKFVYNDSMNGILVEQSLNKADLIFDSFSILKKQIDINYLGIEKTKGRSIISMNNADTTQTDSLPSQWKFSARKIELKDIAYQYDQPDSKLQTSISLKQANISVKTLNLAKSELAILNLQLTEPNISIKTSSNNSTTKVEEPSKTNSVSAPWSLLCGLLKIENGKFLLNDVNADSKNNLTQWMPVEKFNTSIKDVKYTANGSGFNMNELSFDMNHQAILKSGQIVLVSDSTRKSKMLIELIAGVNMENQKLVSKNDEINFSSAFSGSLDSLQIEKFKLSTSSGIDVDVKGYITQLLKMPDSHCKLQFVTKAITRTQTNELIALSGYKIDLPQFAPVSYSGVISNSLLKPDFDVKLQSTSGNVALTGNYDIKNQNGKIDATLLAVKPAELFGDTYPESITCSVTANGCLSKNNLITGNGAIEINSVKYRGVTSHNINADVSVNNNQCEFALQVDDTALACNLKGLFAWQHDSYSGSLAGDFNINQTNTNLLPGQLSVKGEIESAFKIAGVNVESSVELKKISLGNGADIANLDSISCNVNMNNKLVSTQLKTDFLNADFQCESSFDELKHAIESIHFERAFSLDSTDFLNMKAVSTFPVFNLTADINYHPVLNFLVPDSNFNFKKTEIEIAKKAADSLAYANITIDNLKYHNYTCYGAKMQSKFEEDKLNAAISIDSADAESVLIGSSNFNLDILPTHILGTLSIADRTGLPLYQLGAEAQKENGLLKFKSTDADWIINSNTWTMSPAEFLSRQISSDDINANMHLQHDSMKIELVGHTAESLKLDLKNVTLSSIIPPVLFTGLPDGLINANAIYKDGDHQKLDFNFNIDQFKWKDVSINKIASNGKLVADTSGILDAEISATINDSSTIKVTSEPNNNPSVKIFKATFSDAPAKLLEPVISEYVNRLQGNASGAIAIKLENDKPTINGEIQLKKISMNIIKLKSWFSIPDDTLVISKNQLNFNHFTILDSMQNKMHLNGNINLENQENITCDLNVSSDNLKVMNTTVKDDPSFFGSIVINSGLEISGPITNPGIKGKVAMESGTNITYRQIQDLALKELQSTITFQKLNDSLAQNLRIARIKEISSVPNIQTTIEINPKSIFNVEVSSGLDIGVTVSGSGLLNYTMLPNNTMSLSGNYEIKNGTATVKFTGWPLKNFLITSGSSLQWNGKLDDPDLNLEATSRVKGSYINPIDNKNRNVDFIVSMKMLNQLSQLQIVFDVKSNDQYISSVFSSLSQDEIMKQAVNLLLFESVDLPDMQSSTSYMSAQINSFWESQLNSLSKTSLKKVDLSFGIDTRKQTSAEGVQEDKTSLSYEMERKFLKDRASVKVSGRINDDTKAGEQSASVIENFTFEYALDSLDRKYLKVYRNQDYEDILEGEVIKSGVGFIYRKSYNHFRDIWKRSKKEKANTKQPAVKQD